MQYKGVLYFDFDIRMGWIKKMKKDKLGANAVKYIGIEFVREKNSSKLLFLEKDNSLAN